MLLFTGLGVCGLWYVEAALPITETLTTSHFTSCSAGRSSEIFSLIFLTVIAMMIFLETGKTTSVLSTVNRAIWACVCSHICTEREKYRSREIVNPGTEASWMQSYKRKGTQPQSAASPSTLILLQSLFPKVIQNRLSILTQNNFTVISRDQQPHSSTISNLPDYTPLKHKKGTDVGKVAWCC